MQQAVAWQRMRQYMEEDVKVFGEVVGTNRGGVMVDVNGIRGFVPASQLAKVQDRDTDNVVVVVTLRVSVLLGDTNHCWRSHASSTMF